MLIPFTKMHGLGNDFVLVDERKSSVRLDGASLARLADRRFGVGCDQILVLERSSLSQTLARYSVFNADGSGAEHCGNGVRCVARYLRDAGEVKGDTLFLEIDGAAYELAFEADSAVRVDMGRPLFAPDKVPIAGGEQRERYEIVVNGDAYEFGCVSIGNPHAVMLVSDISTAEVSTIGAACQGHEFFPSKVNVGFVQLIDRARIKLRVYERGVGETLACGTGACAAVAVGRLWHQLDAVVEVELPGGILRVEWSGVERESVYMTGPAEHVFNGIIDL